MRNYNTKELTHELESCIELLEVLLSIATPTRERSNPSKKKFCHRWLCNCKAYCFYPIPLKPLVQDH